LFQLPIASHESQSLSSRSFLHTTSTSRFKVFFFFMNLGNSSRYMSLWWILKWVTAFDVLPLCFTSIRQSKHLALIWENTHSCGCATVCPSSQTHFFNLVKWFHIGLPIFQVKLKNNKKISAQENKTVFNIVLT